MLSNLRKTLFNKNIRILCNSIRKYGKKTDSTHKEKDLKDEVEEIQSCLGKVKTVDTKTPLEEGLDEKAFQKKLQFLEKSSDEEIVGYLKEKKIAQYQLEKLLGSTKRAVEIRRNYMGSLLDNPEKLEKLPWENFDYDKVYGQCCESVVGYVSVPIGLIGPLKMNDKSYYVPLATTEGCLVASTQRGITAFLTNGVKSVVINDGMTRAPVLHLPSVERTYELKKWIEENFSLIEKTFNETSSYARLTSIKTTLAGRKIFIKFKCSTGDAMGMNMITKVRI
jgi:hydroxymethylglutaryl-CoA reductase (NADPH)